MRKLLTATLVAIAVVMTAACTSNASAKKFGGTMKIELPAQQKLLNVTWKDKSLWYLTRPMRAGEQPEVYTFREDSNWGVMQGTVTFNEHAAK